MYCECGYCIYNENKSCVLREVEMDALGMCRECIFVTISGKELEAKKKEQLQEIKDKQR